MSATLANGGPQERRRALDFYPTPTEVTDALLQFMQWPAMRVWEPACGNGAMSRVLAAAGHEVVSTDLAHTGFGSGGVDFLTCEPRECDAIVTNPPFNISETFIRTALRHARVVAMVLKSQYWHAAKRHTLFAEAPPSFVLPLTWRPDFMGGERGGAPTMEVHWTVWTPGFGPCVYHPLQRPEPNLFV